jgi:hypothetical protein
MTEEPSASSHAAIYARVSTDDGYCFVSIWPKPNTDTGGEFDMTGYVPYARHPRERKNQDLCWHG